MSNEQFIDMGMTIKYKTKDLKKPIPYLELSFYDNDSHTIRVYKLNETIALQLSNYIMESFQ